MVVRTVTGVVNPRTPNCIGWVMVVVVWETPGVLLKGTEGDGKCTRQVPEPLLGGMDDGHGCVRKDPGPPVKRVRCR